MTQTIPQSREEGFQYTQSVRGIVERIAHQLGNSDYSDAFDSLDEKWVIATVLDAFKWFQGRNPSLFAAQKTFVLEPGARHPRPENCDNLFEIHTILDAKGVESTVCETPYKALQSAQRLEKQMPDCMSDFCIYHYAFSKYNKNEFLISPALKEQTMVEATCSDVKRYFEDTDLIIDCEFAKYIPAVLQYVLWQAMSMDSENPVLLQLSDQHRIAFFDMAPAKPATQRSSDD